MVIEFEENVLKYLVQNDSKRYIELLNQNIFEDVNNQICFAIIKQYYEDYGTKPNKPNLLEFARRNLAYNKYDEEDIREMLDLFRYIFTSLQDSANFTKEIITLEAQKTLTKNVFRDSAEGILNADDSFFTDLLKKFSDIVKLSDTDNVQSFVEKGKPLFAHGIKYQDLKSVVMPTMFKGLNATMGAGGIYPPMYIVIMGGSKAFKTGILLTLSKGFVKTGKNVFYADGENGYFSIQNRFIQSLTKSSYPELLENSFNDIKIGKNGKEYEGELHGKSVKKTFKNLGKWIHKHSKGGDLVIHSYSPSTANMNDIDTDLKELDNLYSWKPDILIFDDMSHFIPIVKQKTDVLDSQQTIKDVIGLNKRWNTASITPAQVVRDATEKEKFSAKDIGRDYGIYKYAHALWSIKSTPEEDKVNLMRLYVVAQREGFSDVLASFLRLDKPTMQVTEISEEEALSLLNEVSSKSNRRKNYSDKDLKDD